MCVTPYHTPKSHLNHQRGVQCGCYTGKGTALPCLKCNASYSLYTVLEFNAFVCYDCGTILYKK